MTATLTRINNRGRALGRPVIKRTRLTRVFGFHDREVGIRVSNRPRLLSPRAEIRDASRARFLASYGSTSASSVGRATPPAARAADAAGGRRPRSGSPNSAPAYLVFDPDYSVEAFDGVNWVPTAIRRARRPIFPLLADSGGVSCSKLPIPAGTAPGRYRISEPSNTAGESPTQGPPGAQHRIHRRALMRSVRRQVLVPLAEDLEGLPEALLGALLVEGVVDVGGVEGVDRRGEGLDLALARLERARERQLEAVERPAAPAPPSRRGSSAARSRAPRPGAGRTPRRRGRARRSGT